jgi:CRP/FNR family cyclic AMP-dependent transcriptional regulator
MDTSHITHIIADSSWFEGVPQEALHQLALAAKIEQHKKKSFLFKVNDVVNSIFFIISGKIKISLTNNLGQQLHLNDLGPGAWLGELGFISKEPEIMELEFKEASQTLNIDSQLVHTIAQKYPIIYQNILKTHDIRTRGTYQILKAMLFNPLKSRLAGRILYILKDLDINPDGSAYIDVKISQKELANLTHGSRQHVNKIFKQWSNDGIVLIRDKRYFVPDVERLRQEAYLLEE